MKPIEKVSIIDRVIDSIKDMIITKKILVGEKLPTEREICDMLKVSRSTVREAFRVLQAMGLVEVKHGKGAFVAKNTGNELNNVLNWFSENEIRIVDLMDVRMAVEPLVVKLAIRRSHNEELNSLIENLKRTQESFKLAAEAGNVIRMGILDDAFHSYISMAAHNKLLASINEKISEAMLEYRIKIFSIKQNTENAYCAHEKIISAIADRNTAEAVEAMSIHVSNALSDALTLAEKKL